ncbi:H(+)/Cl(-) exchange transporter ClcA [Rhodoblastus acidophilus]|uniref:H(+)/Cl(-) exchange transporter ClcA n=1 Tax=Candidatus Rhodoblastus alkanivorans TaxID=2954117 RepID=A0ABS9Z3I4_9HYPH|nr:H(+)/Cl(-) exchange transporter ClcA [Candidatus Rhodoblastus alkanivorans]MCI4677291.1 H(+)/Cl(-) exchange transporter ClcA [Candidatus Rhodoblastus alkanivorans]MCI4682026.1 H(+)/Cl(-) exchange transporter ClcA [Candidatus Rhodoblastus alkanivorans]MDI4643077.1 H(+)/Cl(-) exchange transporter ClcA [Rhodoblastus acidophilus]
MNEQLRMLAEGEKESRGLVPLSLLALATGVGAGLVGALFRMTLESADRLRAEGLVWAHGHHLLGLAAAVLVCAAAAAAAACMVRCLSPHAAGSGIPHVEAVLRGLSAPAPLILLPVKFIGGVLAIGSGLALGREGPSVQMGASIANVIDRFVPLRPADSRVLLAAGAGAGLATAFNAPIAGAVFVLEELVQQFEHHIAIAALAASATAIVVARVLIGDAPDFNVVALPPASMPLETLFMVAGGVAGLLAIAYNRAILGAMAYADRLRIRPVWRAAAIGAGVGALAFFAPDLVGGGDPLTQSALSGKGDLVVLALIFLLRFGLGAVSYAAGTPGGLFAPMLTLGAQSGLMLGSLFQAVFPGAAIRPESFALVGMAAFFAGVVRAPLTGIVLVTEMTANTSLLLPMLGACFAAMLVPTLLGDEPIYDALRHLSMSRERDAKAKRAPPAAMRPSVAPEGVED